jgi:hypothetical protein
MTEPIEMVPDEHMEAVEQAIEEANAGLCRPLTDADWENIRQLARDAAAANQKLTDPPRS